MERFTTHSFVIPDVQLELEEIKNSLLSTHNVDYDTTERKLRALTNKLCATSSSSNLITHVTQPFEKDKKLSCSSCPRSGSCLSCFFSKRSPLTLLLSLQKQDRQDRLRRQDGQDKCFLYST